MKHIKLGGGIALGAQAALLAVLFPLDLAAQSTSIARDLVNPFIGTGGHGHTFPGACVPFGMVQLSPDTRPDGYHDWDGAGGYHYSDSIIHGFSHTHLSGTGVSDLCDVLVMPFAAKPGSDVQNITWSSKFSHEREQAHAGYYRVELPDARVSAELTASPRCGVHRYTFPAGSEALLRVDLEHRDYLEQGSILVVNEREVVGERRSSSWARDQRLFYCMRFSQPIRMEQAENPLAAQIDAFNRSNAVLRFVDLKGEPLIVKVGISAVSIEGARANLEAEVPHWDFDMVKREAVANWDRSLGKIKVKGGSKAEQRTFYSALYHTMITPCLFNDVDGKYRGMDGQVHHADHDVYTIFSLWDTFRALHPLMTILEPERTADWIRTMLLHYQHSGRLPVWELWGNETDCMIGYHSVSVITDAYFKGIRGFDAELALQAMVASAEQDHFGLEAYKRRGYISSEDEAESVSKTLEYAYNDGCIALFAEALGNADVARRFRDRSRNWMNLHDAGAGFFRARRNGGFIESFDPYEVNFHFTEANAWQYSLFVPHDMDLLTERIGGPGSLTQRLDALFTASERTTGRDQSDITGLIGQYAHGNEPSHSFAYLYNLSSRPLSTETYVRKIMRELYSDAPDGLSGNEDCGQMSAWYVMSALGFYPIMPGRADYTTGIPMFEEATIDLGKGRTFRISSEVEGGQADHVVDVLLNSAELRNYRTLRHQDILQGGGLHFLLGPRPGSAPSTSRDEEREPDYGDWVPAAFIDAAGTAFSETMSVRVSCPEGPWSLVMLDALGQYTPVSSPTALVLSDSRTVKARCVNTAGLEGPEVAANFVRYDGSVSMTVESEYAKQYSAGGDQALVDGVRGGKDFRTGEWQGYQGQDLLFTVDLGRPRRIKRLGLGVLQDQKSWIWYPADVEFAVSSNQRQWSTFSVNNEVSREEEGALVQELWSKELDMKVRYVKVRARNGGVCPEWHPGKGGSSWVFADEFLIEYR